MSKEHYKSQPRVTAGNEHGGEWIKETATYETTNNKNVSASLFYKTNIVSTNLNFISIEKEALRYIGNKNFNIDRIPGNKDETLTEIISNKGWSNVPKRLSNDELAYSLMKNNGKFVYRALSEEIYKNDFYNGDIWIGQGSFGNGIYMAYEKLDTASYGKHIAVAIVDNDMSFASNENRLEHQKFLEYISNKIDIIEKYGTMEDFRNYKNLRNMMSDYVKYVAFSG